MGASLAVILINLWLKEDYIEICHGCQEKLTYRTNGVARNACLHF